MATAKEQISAECESLFLEFGETITYNSQDITAVIEKGSNPESGNVFQGTGRSSRARIWVRMSDVESPDTNDSIQINGVDWQVAEIKESMDGMHYIQLIGQENPY